MAQVTYRGVVYDTDRNKAKQTNKVDLTYRGVRQEKELAAIMKKRNSAGWKLISTSTAIVDTKNQFSNLYLFKKKYSFCTSTF